MIEIKIELFERNGSFNAQLVVDYETTLLGEGKTPYEALGNLIEDMAEHEYFRED